MHCINYISASLPFTAYLASQNNSFSRPLRLKSCSTTADAAWKDYYCANFGWKGILVTEMIFIMIRTPV